MWFQRSRAKWLVDRERNTKYYHLKTVNRRRNNKNFMIKDDSRKWIEDRDQIKSLVNEFYKKLFSLGGNCNSWKQTNLSFPRIML